MLKVLVTYAVQEEFVEIKWPDAECYYVRTGVGKVKSAYYVAEALRQVQPDLVLNIGTAGTVAHRVGDVFVCCTFVDRDMQKLSAFGLDQPIDTFPLLQQRHLHRPWMGRATCNTGDSFLTDERDVSGDVVDMEAYAQAFVCQSQEVPFLSIKYVTDVVGQNSVKHWEDKLADAKAALARYVASVQL